MIHNSCINKLILCTSMQTSGPVFCIYFTNSTDVLRMYLYNITIQTPTSIFEMCWWFKNKQQAHWRERFVISVYFPHYQLHTSFKYLDVDVIRTTASLIINSSTEHYMNVRNISSLDGRIHKMIPAFVHILILYPDGVVIVNRSGFNNKQRQHT